MEEPLLEHLFEEKIISHTRSLCPDCEYPDHVTTLDAQLFEQDGRVMIRKRCPEHDEFTDVIWSSRKMWDRAERYARTGSGIQNPYITKESPECPDDCGLCYEHKSHPALVNMVITNRCDLACWYCFFFAEKVGYVYEPNLEQIRQMVRAVRNVRPIPGNAIQLTGGEPTLREDLEEIVRICREEGIEHVQLNTDAINISRNPDLVRKLRAAGVNTVYMSFDGVTPKTNPKNYYEIPGAIENCRTADLGIVLVPTVIKTINDHEVGGIVRFAQKEMGTIRGIIYQPVSLTGRMTRKDRETFRITIPDVIERIEEQTGGEIVSEDFFPVPAVSSVSDFVGALSGRRYELTSHFACGMATYVFKQDDKLIPLPRFVDIDGLFEYMREKTEEIRDGKSVTRAKLEFASHLVFGKVVNW